MQMVKTWVYPGAIPTRKAWSFGKEISIPKGYVFCEIGNPFVTRFIKKRAKTIYEVCVKENKYGSTTIGYWVTERIRNSAFRAERETQDKRDRMRERRLQKQIQQLSQIQERVKKLYPVAPQDAIDNVMASFEPKSGSVGRSSSLFLDDKIDLAMIATIRHDHTDYDCELRTRGKGMDYDERQEIRDEVRAEIRPVIQRIKNEWQASSLTTTGTT